MSQLGQVTIVPYVSQLQSVFLITEDFPALSVTEVVVCEALYLFIFLEQCQSWLAKSGCEQSSSLIK